jgi:triacylglycerol esterase/lipase EstA (alpha/beta hydrolase family)
MTARRTVTARRSLIPVNMYPVQQGIRRITLVAGVVVALAAGVLATVVSTAAAAPHYPVGDGATGYAAEVAAPTSSPPGVNIWTCKPSAAHPYPVVLLPGTLVNVAESWQALGPILANDGYCVYGLSYGPDSLTPITGGRVSAVGEIGQSATQLAAFVRRVRKSTGAAKVDIVGWSQGGMMPRQYIKFDGGARYVHDLVGLAPSSHGTTIDGLFALVNADTLIGLPATTTLAQCPACTEQEVGSSFLTRLNAGGDTVPGVHYTVIESDLDEVVTPYASAFLTGPDVTNITLQDQCPLDLADHLAMPYDGPALQDVVNALGADSPSFKPDCGLSLPVLGSL